MQDERDHNPPKRCPRCGGPVKWIARHSFLFDRRMRYWVKCVQCGDVQLRSQRLVN